MNTTHATGCDETTHVITDLIEILEYFKAFQWCDTQHKAELCIEYSDGDHPLIRLSANGSHNPYGLLRGVLVWDPRITMYKEFSVYMKHHIDQDDSCSCNMEQPGMWNSYTDNTHHIPPSHKADGRWKTAYFRLVSENWKQNNRS
jgi:hypothetical protein